MHLPTNGTLTKLKLISTGVVLLCAVAGGMYSAYAFGEEYHKQFAPKEQLVLATKEFKQEAKALKLSMIEQTIRRYEDELFALDFRISEGTATALDRANKARIERQVVELRSKVLQIKRQPIE